MPQFILPIGYMVTSLKADINDRCYIGGPFRHTIEYQLDRYKDPDTRTRALFKINQMAFRYTDYLMEQFPELASTVSHATLAMQIAETLISETRE